MNTLKAMTLLGTTIALTAMLGPDTADAGIDAGGSPKSSRGSVTAFGSIYVNGVRYNTDNALFIIDGAIGTEADLEVGEIVTVLGFAEGATGTASVVISDNVVAGPITAIDADSGRMAVLGQQVIVGPDTAFAVADGLESLADLGTNDNVAVSGHVNAWGEILATHIGRDSGHGFDATGTVNYVDDANQQLVINGMLVDYSAANMQGFSNGAPESGDIVSIKAEGIDAGGSTVASQVLVSSQVLVGQAGQDADIEGLVTTYNAPWDFEVDGTPIKLGWGTRYEGGWIFDLGLDRKLEVEGKFDSDGRLVAERIIFEGEATTSIHGQVDAVYGDTVIVDGLAVLMRDDTAYQDGSDYGERRFTTANLHAGDYVEIAAYTDDGDVIATRLERDDDDDGDDEDDD